MLRSYHLLPLVVGLFESVVACSGDGAAFHAAPASGGQSSAGTSSGESGSSGKSGTAGRSSQGGSNRGDGGNGSAETGGEPANDGGAGAMPGAGGTPADGPDYENLSEQHVTAFPARLTFQTDAYVDELSLVWTTEGATHAYVSDGGWNGGGCAHFTPPTAEGYSGLGSFHLSALGATHLSMRWLMKVGPTMGQYGFGNKTLLFVRNPNDAQHHRPMIITRPDPGHPGAFVPGACDGTVCQYKIAPGNAEPYWPDGSDTFWLSTNGYAEQWVSWEFESDASAGWIRLYITTQDGRFNDTLYVENPMVDSEPGGTFEYIDILGGYFGASQADPGNWFELDEVVIHNRHIGPPPGFVR